MNKAFKLKTIEDFNSVDVFDTITLTYDDRYRRRILMKSDHGLEFLLDLAKTTELRSGNFIELEDGRLIEIIAASEKLQVLVVEQESETGGSISSANNLLSNSTSLP